MDDGWYIYMKRADGMRCRWWMYPRVSLAYHMLEILIDDDAGTCLMVWSVGRGKEGKSGRREGEVGERRWSERKAGIKQRRHANTPRPPFSYTSYAASSAHP